MLLKMKQKASLAAAPRSIDRFHKYGRFFSDLLTVLNVVPPTAYIDIFHNMSYANQASTVAARGGLCYGQLFPPQRALSP
jgi:hypothetical protein